jgi:hypothetical protein
MQAVESFTPAMMAANGSEALYGVFLTTVAAHRVGNRPGRQEPRKRKRRHAWRDYLMVPRNRCHRRLLYANSLAGLVLGPLFGGAVSYVGARAVASGFLT